MQIIQLAFPILIISVILYIFLLTMNNIVWGYKGISIDKGSQEYRRRKRLLMLISIPTSFFVLVAIGLLIS